MRLLKRLKTFSARHLCQAARKSKTYAAYVAIKKEQKQKLSKNLILQKKNDLGLRVNVRLHTSDGYLKSHYALNQTDSKTADARRSIHTSCPSTVIAAPERLRRAT